MKHFLLLFVLSWLSAAYAQRPLESSSDIYQEIKRLNVLTNVLYLAAHPDDENTRLISWLENEKLARTAYLSLTRGSGGQNLIGTEKGPAMGVLRTQELIEARKIDGGEQYFSSAIDFGYSKTSDETLEIWNKEEVLGDVVWTIRKFRPDIIITRFPPDKRAGHGHHTASAILAEEAFKMSSDATNYPKQMGYLRLFYNDSVATFKEIIQSPWQAKRILWNTSVWWDQQLPEKAAKADDYIKIDIGEYNDVLGLSYSEIASDSRSQHQSQGFGSARTRGKQIEYLKHTAGEKAEKDLFEDINTTWSRVPDSEKIQELVNSIIKEYDFKQPANSLKKLVDLYALLEKKLSPIDASQLKIIDGTQRINQKKDDFFIEHKLEDVRRLIKAVAGIHAEYLAKQSNYIEGKEIEITGNFNLIVRNADYKILLNSIDERNSITTELPIQLKRNELVKLTFKGFVQEPFNQNISLSNPYWLFKNEKSFNPSQKGLSENLPLIYIRYELLIDGTSVFFTEPIDFKWVDRADGELHRDVEIYPAATATPEKNVYLFSGQKSMAVDVLVEAHTNNFKSELIPQLPEGWSTQPEKISVSLNNAGDQRSFRFELYSPKENSMGEVKFLWGDSPANAFQLIDYPHIKPQVMFPPASAKIVNTTVNKTVNHLLYIVGSGDEVAQNLKQIGFEITSIQADKLAITDLSKFETILVGIRAYNTSEYMKSGNTILNQFAENGGTVIVQYNTSRGLKADQIGPYKLHLSRNRVTKEDCKVNFLAKKHPILNRPNKITQEDFNHWVQERGLYFADEWDKEHYTPIISWNDPGEKPQHGGLLIAKHGNGHFIYTGISFFRQLPSGVPGAYRLLSNLISYGQE